MHQASEPFPCRTIADCGMGKKMEITLSCRLWALGLFLIRSPRKENQVKSGKSNELSSKLLKEGCIGDY